jgi:hypothetical protein
MPSKPTSGYDNEEMPDSVPPQNQGAIPVIVRLVDAELGEHYRPAEARRWTETHVMVGLYRTDPDTGRRKDRLAWLRAEDVHRVFPRGYPQPGRTAPTGSSTQISSGCAWSQGGGQTPPFSTRTDSRRPIGRLDMRMRSGSVGPHTRTSTPPWYGYGIMAAMLSQSGPAHS